MSKDKKELSEKRDYRAIIATFIKEGGDKIGSVAKSKPRNEKDRVELEEKFKKDIVLLNKSISDIKAENKKIDETLTVQEKDDLVLLSNIFKDKGMHLSKSSDLSWNFSDYITEKENFLHRVMDLKIPRNSNMTIQDMINEKDPSAGNRIKNNDKFQGTAAWFILRLYWDECLLRKRIAELSDPKNLERSIEEIEKSNKDITSLNDEVKKLFNKLNIQIQVRLALTSTPQGIEIIKKCNDQLSDIEKNFKKLHGPLELLNNAEPELNGQKKVIDYYERNIKKFDGIIMQLGGYNIEKMREDNEKSLQTVQKLQIIVIQKENNLKEWALELPKRLNVLKEQITQNLKKLEESQGNVVSNKDDIGNESLLKQIELLKKEMETLQKENQALKQENQALKKAPPIPSSPVQKPISPTLASTQAASPPAIPAKVTPIIAKPALPPTPPKSATTARAATPPPISSVAANPAKSLTAAKSYTPPPVTSSAPKPAATLVKPTTPPPSKPASPVAGPTAPSAKTSTIAPTAKTPTTSAAAPLNVAQQIAAQIAKNKEAAAAKAAQAGGSKPKPPNK